MANQQSEKLTAEEYLALQEAIGNGALLSGLRKIFIAEELSKLGAMRSEALGTGRASEIVKYAAESRLCAEWEQIFRNRMERMIPTTR